MPNEGRLKVDPFGLAIGGLLYTEHLIFGPWGGGVRRAWPGCFAFEEPSMAAFFSVILGLCFGLSQRPADARGRR